MKQITKRGVAVKHRFIHHQLAHLRSIGPCFARLCVVAALLSATWAAAQSAEHDVSVKLPALYGIRIVDSSNLPALAPSVSFDYSADVAGYDAAVAGPGYAQASSVTDFSDVQVYVRKNAADFALWSVQVTASPLVNKSGAAGAGLALQDISVERGLASGLQQEAVTTLGIVQSRWALSNSEQLIAFSARSTSGWKSLGFNGLDYRVKVDGDEDPGEYATTVTYTIVEP